MTYSAEVLADSPLAYWRVNEASGAFADLSGNGKTLTAQNSPTLGSPGPFAGESAVVLDGASQYLASNQGINNSDYSIELWWKGTDTAGSLASSRSSAGSSMTLGLGVAPVGGGIAGDFYLGVDGTGIWYGIRTTAAYNNGVWHHIVGVWDGVAGSSVTTAQLKIYVDGVAVGVTAATYQSQAAPINSGTGSYSFGISTAGALSNLALYPVPLSAARVAAHYAAATAGGGTTTVPIPQAVVTLTANQITAVPTITGSADTRNRGSSLGQLVGQAIPTLTIPVVEPPTSVYPVGAGTAIEAAFSLPEIVLDNGRATNVEPTWFTQPAKRFRVVADNIDISFFRDYRTRVGSFKLTEPYSFGSTSLTLDQAHKVYEIPGAGALPFLRQGARIRYDLVDPATNEVVKEGVYRGRVIAPRAGSSTVEIGGELSGPASLRYRPTPLYRRVADLGRWAWQACRNVGVHFTPHGGPVVGIPLADGGGQQYLGWLDYLCAMSAGVDGSQYTIRWTDTGWTFAPKDRTTKHYTVWLDGARVVHDLTNDAAVQPNAYYLTGVNGNGRRMKGAVYPGMIQGPTPPYPFNDNRAFGVGTTDAGTDSGDGVSVMMNRLMGTSYLGVLDAFGTTFTAAMSNAVKDLQRKANLTVTGTMTPATWNALYDLSTLGLTIGQAQIQPMVIDPAVNPFDRTSSGAVSGRNDARDRSVLRVDTAVDVGAGVTKPLMRQWARQDMARSKGAWTGTITLHTDVFRGEYAHGDPDPDLASKFEVEAGENLWVPNFQPNAAAVAAGGTLFHIGYADADPESDTVTFTVDTGARDAVDLAAIKARNLEARRNPEKEWIRDHRTSRRTVDTAVEWDEFAGFVYDKVTLAGNKWNTFPVISGSEGTVARIRVLLTNTPEWVMCVAGRRLGRGMLAKRIGNPFNVNSKGETRWTDADVQDWLHDDRLVVYTAGQKSQPCGYWPKEHTNNNGDVTDNPRTGKWQDDQGFGYRTFRFTVLWVAIYPDRDCVLNPQHMMWDQLETGV